MEEPPVVNPVSVELGEQSDSVLDQLAEKRRVIADTKEAYINVPGYDSSPPVLQVKYRLLTGPDFNRIAENARMLFKNRWERQLMAGVDTCIEACSGLFLEFEDGTEKKPLTIGGQPVMGFTAALATGLKFADKVADVQDHRQVFMALFGGNETMIGRHIFQLNRWMSDVSLDVNADILGNL